MTSAQKHFHMRPDGNGGVRLTMRTKWRDQLATEIDPDGVARSKTPTDENGDEPMGDIIHVFGPLGEGKYAKLVEQDNGTIAVVVVSEPDDVLGNTTLNNSGVVGDRRSAYLTQSLGGDAQKLSQMNAANKAHYKR